MGERKAMDGMDYMDDMDRKGRVVCRWLACALLVGSVQVATAQEPPPPLVDPKSPPPAAASPELSAIQRDIGEIKSDMQILQETLDLIVNRMMADLEKENEQLREELRRLQEGGAVASPMTQPNAGFVPRPGAALFEEVAQEPLPEESAEEQQVEFGWEVVSEWGREPEAAKKLGASSLKGMVIVVPEGSERADVEELARALRSEFSSYDNINIEIFDDPQAAEDYAASQVADPNHRVLSVSKHQASGRDKILYLGGGENAQELAPPEGAASAAPAPADAEQAPAPEEPAESEDTGDQETDPPPLEAASP